MTSTPPRDTVAEPPSRTRRWLRDLAIVAVAVSLGIGATTLLRDGRGSSGPGLDLPEQSARAIADGPVRDTTPVVPAGDATTPEAAAAGFLAAESDGDFATSYTYLSADDRATWPSPTRWTAAHAQQLPITGFRITGTEERRGDTYVLADLTLRSALDPVLGLIPARATADVLVVPDGETWRVAFADLQVASVLPDEAGAVDAARLWAEAVQGCDAPDTLVRPLYGRPALADDLCDAPGELRLGEATRLAPNGDANDLVAAFGPDAIGWARVVTITAPVEFGVVLAPVDDTWQVVGLVRSR